jgi:hypothetical protein
MFPTGKTAGPLVKLVNYDIVLYAIVRTLPQICQKYDTYMSRAFCGNSSLPEFLMDMLCLILFWPGSGSLWLLQVGIMFLTVAVAIAR